MVAAVSRGEESGAIGVARGWAVVDMGGPGEETKRKSGDLDFFVLRV